MKIMVVGGGGREHTLIWKIAQSPLVKKIYCAPGNAGISEVGECVDIDVKNIERLAEFAKDKNIDLTVVGPEIPLVAGIVNVFEKNGLKIFGPSKDAAQLEGSKIFAKNLMTKYGIPTAKYKVFDNPEKAQDFIKEIGPPVVIKADGLAAGKGVIISNTQQEAESAIKKIMEDKEFGDAGDKIIVEECLEGRELSILAFTDGKTVIPMISSQDHKRVYDNDKGPNTGGMGAFAPSPFYTSELAQMVEEEVLKKTVNAMKMEGITYKGILYAGLMLTSEGVKVLEYNCRFGDPETQAVLPLLDTDLIEIMEAVVEDRLDEMTIKWKNKSAVCIVMSSKGYPAEYEAGLEIKGLEDVKGLNEIFIFHAGTTFENGKITTSGGRVLGITALGDKIETAAKEAYKGVKSIYFEGAHYRKDIGDNI
ncbi:MAG TPA: phosphoribosylamine--glycine ligase [Thermoanaerobacterales bacterium]|nr:phosphoribosylamine--glycine ligase [Thermoanaerobacterales bacterium]